LSKKWVGLHFGPFFHRAIWAPWFLMNKYWVPTSNQVAMYIYSNFFPKKKFLFLLWLSWRAKRK
jgi:hypothetical protein